mgnify:CR=1 FL=1
MDRLRRESAAAIGAERIGNLKDGIMKRLAVIMLCVALPLWILSCGRCGKTGNGETVAGAAAAGEVVIADSLPVKVQVRDGYGRMVILKEPGRTVDVEFDSGGCDLLYGEITGVGDMANVRFNQIVMPDGTSDGPFGRSIEYGLEQQGTYHLLIGESLMAGERGAASSCSNCGWVARFPIPRDITISSTTAIPKTGCRQPPSPRARSSIRCSARRP